MSISIKLVDLVFGEEDSYESNEDALMENKKTEFKHRIERLKKAKKLIRKFKKAKKELNKTITFEYKLYKESRNKNLSIENKIKIEKIVKEYIPLLAFKFSNMNKKKQKKNKKIFLNSLKVYNREINETLEKLSKIKEDIFLKEVNFANEISQNKKRLKEFKKCVDMASGKTKIKKKKKKEK